MQGWTGALAVLHTLSYVALVGGLAWLVATERWVRPEGWASQATVDRALVATGSMLSVALATVIYTGLGLYWLKSGSFSWDAQTPWRAGQLLKGILFMGFWVHWGWTEVVTLDPLRKSIPAPGADAPAPGYQEAHRRGWRALSFLLLEGAVIAGIAAWVGASSPG